MYICTFYYSIQDRQMSTAFYCVLFVKVKKSPDLLSGD